MSGHSKWAKIKRAKGITDAKRGAVFTRIARVITLTTQEGGGDPGMNFSLRLQIEKARQANMPQENIDRAIKKGTGEIQADIVKNVVYEAITHFGVNVLIDCSTDNTNRTYSEVKNVIERLGSKTAPGGSISWQFSEQGLIEVAAAKLQKSMKYGTSDSYITTPAEELEESLMELDGILDYEVFDPKTDPEYEVTPERPLDRKIFSLRTEKSALKQVAEKLGAAGWQVLESEMIQHPATTVEISAENREKLDHLLSELEELDDVNNVFTNVKD